MYAGVLRVDRHIPPELARKIGLIDAVDPLGFGDLLDVPARTDDFPLLVPEWASLLPPHGQFPLDNLKRHILVFGETGSGKTASGLLPIVHAIVKSSVFKDRRRVSCALVVDPKRELAAAIREMGRPPTMIGSPDTGGAGSSGSYVFNLMEHIDAPDDLVGHATAILTRLGGLTYSPASTLLGKQFGGRDPYWAAEGVKMATAALGIALLLQLQKERARIFDKEGRLRERLHVDVDAWNKVDPPPGNTEDKETLTIARTRAAADVRRTLEMCAETAGISALTAEAARYIKQESRWLDRLTERYRESARDLRSHGFVTDRLRDGGARVHEIRGWSFKAYDLDVHLEWRIDDAHDVSSAPWGAVQLPVDTVTLGEEFERMKDTLRECGPPLATMGTRGEREDFEFRDDSSRVARASVPALHRDPEVANDCERLLVIMDVADGIGRRDAARPGELVRMERELLEGLRDLRERFDPDREATPDPSSWVLMTALHTVLGSSRDSFIGARCRYNVECDDGTDRWKFEELPPAENLAEYGEDDCGHPLPDYPESTAFEWYEHETGRSAAIATTCAIRHAEELRTMVEDYGIRLCDILLEDEEKGKAEWERRIQEKVRRRAELVTAVLKACQDLRDRASKNKCVLLQQPFRLIGMIDGGALFENESIAEGMERGERSYRMHLESHEKDNRHVNEDGHVRSGVSVVGLADLIVKEGFRGDVMKAWPQWLKQIKAAIAESNEVEPPGFEELERNIAYYAGLSGARTTGAVLRGVRDRERLLSRLFRRARREDPVLRSRTLLAECRVAKVRSGDTVR